MSLLIGHCFRVSGLFSDSEVGPDGDEDAEVGGRDEDHGDEPGQHHQHPDVSPGGIVSRKVVERTADQVSLEW